MHLKLQRALAILLSPCHPFRNQQVSQFKAFPVCFCSPTTQHEKSANAYGYGTLALTPNSLVSGFRCFSRSHEGLNRRPHGYDPWHPMAKLQLCTVDLCRPMPSPRGNSKVSPHQRSGHSVLSRTQGRPWAKHQSGFHGSGSRKTNDTPPDAETFLPDYQSNEFRYKVGPQFKLVKIRHLTCTITGSDTAVIPSYVNQLR